MRSKKFKGGNPYEKPLKKVLSLVLCVAVMLSRSWAGAAFLDQDKIEKYRGR